jgi:hypothetical protein
VLIFTGWRFFSKKTPSLFGTHDAGWSRVVL